MKYFEFNSVCDKFTKITNIVDQNLLISYLPFFVAFSLVCLVLTISFVWRIVLTIALHLPAQCVPFPIKPALHKHTRWLPTEISLQKALESQKMPSHDPSAEMTPKKSGYWNNSLFCAFIVVVVVYIFSTNRRMHSKERSNQGCN